MKKKVTKWIDSIEEVSIETAINDFFVEDWNPKDWEETEEFIDTYIEEEFTNISDKEKNQLKSEIKREYDKRVSNLRQEEIDQLKDRESILEVLGEAMFDYCDEGEVGFMLSAGEIIDLIIENGNK